MTPQRIQLRRTRGWRKPEGTVVVSRPTRWGNPWTVDRTGSREAAVERFERHLRVRASHSPGWFDVLNYPSDEEIRRDLAGKDLACWCPLDQPCHADVLLEIANGNRQTTIYDALEATPCHNLLAPGTYCAECGTYNPNEEDDR